MRYALVACISGRAGADAQRIVGVPELAYVGNHGLELEPAAADWAARLHEFLATVDWPELEDKGLTAALHYRNADERLALTTLGAVATRARAHSSRRRTSTFPPPGAKTAGRSRSRS